MPRRFVDFPIHLKNDVVTALQFIRPRITPSTHGERAAEFWQLFHGVTDRKGWALPSPKWSRCPRTAARISMRHITSIRRFEAASASAKSTRCRSTYARSDVKVDLRHLPDGHVGKTESVEPEMLRIGLAFQALDIVLINTVASTALRACRRQYRGLMI